MQLFKHSCIFYCSCIPDNDGMAYKISCIIIIRIAVFLSGHICQAINQPPILVIAFLL